MYKILEWDRYFENAQSRRFDTTKWVAMPNKRGFGYVKTLKQKNGEAIFGAWCAIIQLASTCSPRGELQSNGIPYTIEDISDITLFSDKTIRDALGYFCNTLKWIEDTTSNTAVLPSSHSGITQLASAIPILSIPILSNPILSNKEECVKNTAVIPKCEHSNTALKEKIPPKVEEITAYCVERKNGVDPVRFFDFYESKGWMVGKSKMKSWRAAVRTWEKNTNNWSNKNQSSVGANYTRYKNGVPVE